MANLLNLVKKVSDLRHFRMKTSIFVENKEVTNILHHSRHFALAWRLLEEFNVRAFSSLDRDLKIKINGREVMIKIAKCNYDYEFSLSYGAGSLMAMISGNKSKKTPEAIAKEIVEWAIQFLTMLCGKSDERPVHFKLSDAVCADKEIMACWQRLREYHVSYLAPNVCKDGSYTYVTTIVINGQRYNIDSEKKSIPENDANLHGIYELSTFENLPVIHTELKSISSLDTMLSAIQEDLNHMLDKANVIKEKWQQ